MKKMNMTIVIGMCVPILTAGLAVPSARAGHVESQWLVSLGAPGGVTFNDVAWSPDGSYAIFVGRNVGGGVAYWYYPENSTWWLIGGVINSPNLTAVKYAPQSLLGPHFFIVGISTVAGYWYWVRSPAENTNEGSAGPLAHFNATDIVYNPYRGSAYGSMVVVGNKTAAGAYCYAYDLANSSWSMLTNDLNSSYNVMTAVAVGGGSDPSLIIAGVNSFNGVGAHYRYNYSTGQNGYGWGMVKTPNDIVYDSGNDRAIFVCGNRAPGDMVAIYSASGPLFNALVPMGGNVWWTDNLQAIDGNDVRGIIVGYNTSSNRGVVYDIDNIGLTLKSNNSAMFANENFTSVAIRQRGIPMALITGSAFKYNFINSDSSIIVNTVYPHIWNMEMYYQNDSASVLNSMVNVNPGDGSNWYRINVTGNYSSVAGGADAIDNVSVYLWWDGGANGDFSGLVDTGWPNRGLHMQWTKAGGFSMVFPLSGESEFLWGTTQIDVAPGPNYTFSFAFRMNQQAWNASGDGTWDAGLNTPPNRWRSDDGVDDQTTVAALDDAWSWDIKAAVTDTVHSASISAFDEFGIARFVYLGTGASLPGGGLLSGSGAPGQTVTLQPSVNQNVTFNANCNYDLRTWSTDLSAIIPANGVIPAANLSVAGGQWAGLQALGGSGEPNAIWLIGSLGPGGYGVPGSTGTSNNTWNAVDGGFSVYWTCSIPLGKAEDSYVGTITYSIRPVV
ncbi:MAG: hypothetical protein HZB92_00555 [Euryarchaeota archaeon]|nr:hypothetical protein [Euryarchaeota archaeon]